MCRLTRPSRQQETAADACKASRFTTLREEPEISPYVPKDARQGNSVAWKRLAALKGFQSRCDMIRRAACQRLSCWHEFRATWRGSRPVARRRHYGSGALRPKGLLACTPLSGLATTWLASVGPKQKALRRPRRLWQKKKRTATVERLFFSRAPQRTLAVTGHQVKRELTIHPN